METEQRFICFILIVYAFSTLHTSTLLPLLKIYFKNNHCVSAMLQKSCKALGHLQYGVWLIVKELSAGVSGSDSSSALCQGLCVSPSSHQPCEVGVIPRVLQVGKLRKSKIQ